MKKVGLIFGQSNFFSYLCIVKQKEIKMNKAERNIRTTEILCLIGVIAFGENNGNAFEITPKLPIIFSEGIDIDGIAYNVDLLRVETSDKGLVCWFIDKEEDTFFVTLHSLLESNPLLYSAIVSHIFTLIEYVDC